MEDLIRQYPTVEGLFGSQDYCECEQCRSVFSPAAYLTALLRFIDPGQPVAGAIYTPYEVLRGRRPDLSRLRLDCENTNTTLPYIDLVNEVFEHYVAHSDGDDPMAGYVGHNTGETSSAELLAEPQNVESAAYDALKSARYPLLLPFDLWLETVRAFLQHFDMPLWKLMEVLRADDNLEFLVSSTEDGAYDRAAIFAERLGLSADEYEIFTASTPLGTWHELYGYDDPENTADENQADALGAVQFAKTLAQRLGLNYKELTEISQTGFVNPGLRELALVWKLGLEISDVPRFFDETMTEAESEAFEAALEEIDARFPSGSFNSRLALENLVNGGAFGRTLLLRDWTALQSANLMTVCDFENTVLEYADSTLDDDHPAEGLDYLRIVLFVRLWRKLGWTIEETDRALQTFLPVVPGLLTEANIGASLQTALAYLAHFKELEERLKPGKAGRMNLLTLWSELPTTGRNPLYAQLFLRPGIPPAERLVFDHPLGEYLRYREADGTYQAFWWDPGRRRQSLIDAGVPAEDITAEVLAEESPAEGYVSLEQHLAAVQAALNLSDTEIRLVLEDAGLQRAAQPLSMAIVSLLYRYTLLARLLKLSVRETIALKGLSGLNPFEPLSAGTLTLLGDDYPYQRTLAFVDLAQKIRASGFKVDDLDYLVRHRFDPMGKYRPDQGALLALVKTLGDGIGRIEQELSALADPSAVTDEMLQQKLAFILSAEVASGFWATLKGTRVGLAEQIGAVLEALTPTLEFEAVEEDVEPELQLSAERLAGYPAISVSYDLWTRRQRLVHRGILYDAERFAIADEDIAPLSNLLGQVQEQGWAIYSSLVWSSIGMLAASPDFEFVVDRPDTASAARLDPADFDGQPAVRVHYDEDTGTQYLTYRGILSSSKESALRALGGDVLGDLVTKVKLRSDALLGALRSGILARRDFDTVFADQDSFPDTLEESRAELARAIVPFIRRKLVLDLVAQVLDGAAGPDAPITRALLADVDLLVDPDYPDAPLVQAFNAAGQRGVSATFRDAAGDVLQYSPRLTRCRTTGEDDVSLSPPGTQTVRFEGCLEVPADGVYRFYMMLGRTGAEGEMRFTALADAVVAFPPEDSAASAGEERSGFVELKRGQLYEFLFDATGLGGGQASLEVQGENVPRGDVVERLAVYPQSAVTRIQRASLLLGKSLQIVQTTALSERELRYMLANRADFDEIDLSKLALRDASSELEAAAVRLMQDDETLSPATAMTMARDANLELAVEEETVTQRFDSLMTLVEYARLKQEIAGGRDDLVDVLAAAGRTYANPPSGSRAGTSETAPWIRLAELTRRDANTVLTLARRFKYVEPDDDAAAAELTANAGFATVGGIRRLWEALQLVHQLGVAAEVAIGWARREFDLAGARDLRDAFKAGYDVQAWQQVVRPISNALRECRRDALVAFIMHRKGYQRIEQLYDHFLIDAGMQPVVLTSRVQLAIASVQTFIQRCLLNLENDVAPSAIAARQWGWMQRYRVWEAHLRLCMYYPENWLEPEFRDDKTHLYQELESTLLQDEVTNEVAENAFFMYLTKLEEIARLDIVTTYWEERPDAPVFHVIGRSHNLPYRYFYRSRSNNAWTPWEPINAEIEGDHVVTIVWRDRVHLFWLTFMERAEQASGEIVLAQPLAIAPLERTVEVQLNWSDRFQGQWSTRKSGGFDDPLLLKAGPDFKTSMVALRAVRERGPQGSEGAVQIRIHFERMVRVKSDFTLTKGSDPEGTGPTLVDIGQGKVTMTMTKTDKALRLENRNSRPAPIQGQPPVTLMFSDPGGPLDPKVTRHCGNGAFQLTGSRIVSGALAGGPVSVSESEEDDILAEGPGEYSLVVSAYPWPAPTEPEQNEAMLWPLEKPFFYQDRFACFFVEPSVENAEIDEDYNTFTPARVPPKFVDDEWMNKADIAAAKLEELGLLGGSLLDEVLGPGVHIDQGDLDPRILDALIAEGSRDWMLDNRSGMPIGENTFGPQGGLR